MISTAPDVSYWAPGYQPPTLYRYVATGHRPVTAESPEAAARVIAERIARRSYGRRGYCRVLRLDSWTQDGSTHHYQAFVGRDVLGRGRRPTGTTSGHNEWITVHLAA